MSTREDNYAKYMGKLEETKNFQRMASDSTGTNVREVYAKNLLVLPITDPHDANIFELLKTANTLGAVIALNGDYTNNQFTFSKNADVYADLRTPDGQLRWFTMICEKAAEQGIDLSNLTVGIIDGNHEYRLYKATSIRQTYWMSKALGIEDKYAANALKCTFIFKPLNNKKLEYSFNMFMRHGEGNSVNNGRNVTQSLQNPQMRGADLYITGHTHGFNFGNQIVNYPSTDGKLISKTTYAANFGSMQYGSEYADRAGYPLSARLNGEILNISIIPDKETKKPRACVELINIKDILTPEFKTMLETVKKKFKQIEKNKEVLTEEQASEEYDKVINYAAQRLIQLNKNQKEINDKFSFGTLSGFLVGDPERRNQDLIKNYVAGLAAQPNLHTVITGNMFSVVKEKLTKKDEKQDSTGGIIDEIFANMYNSAKKVKPIAYSIMGYHYGETENKLLEHPILLRKLAKKAIKTLQIEQSLVFEDMSEADIEKEIITRQAEVLEKANLQMIDDRIKCLRKSSAYMRQFYAWLEKKRAKNKGKDLDAEDELRHYVGFLLRKEGKFLSLQGTPEINETIPGFRIDATDIKNVAKDVISNIYLTMVGLTPEQIKEIKVQHQANQPVAYQIPLTAPDGSKKTFNLGVQATSGTAGRQAQENYLKRDESLYIGFDMFVSSPKVGEEFVTKSTTTYIDIKGEQHTIDTYHATTPSLAGPNKYVNTAISDPRIYFIKVSEKDPLVKQIETSGNTMYRSKGKYTYVLESLDYRNKLNYVEMQMQCINIAYEQSIKATIDRINKTNAIVAPSNVHLVEKAFARRNKEIKEAEKGKEAKQQPVTTETQPEAQQETEVTKEEAEQATNVEVEVG